MNSESQVIIYGPNVNLTERKSALNNNIQEVVTVGDLKGYKVFTAILTQSGGDDPASIYGDEYSLIVGTTYTIAQQEEPLILGDFTNVGAPNNELGTSFIATGTTPNSWGTTSLLYNGGAPVANVLDNTIGNIWFSYNDIGFYRILSNGLFTDGKITLQSNKHISGTGTDLNFSDNATINLVSYNGETQSNNALIGNSFFNFIEIRVYN